MSLQEKIRTDMVCAMKAKDSVRLDVLRGLITLFTLELTSTKRTPQDKLTDNEVISVIRRALKQRKEASEQYTAGGRPELAKKEDDEGVILGGYLPAMMSTDEIGKVVKDKIKSLGVTDKSAMGKLIGAVMAELKGKADGADVKSAVEKLLS